MISAMIDRLGSLSRAVARILFPERDASSSRPCLDSSGRAGRKRALQLKWQFENASLYVRGLGEEQGERFGRGLDYLFND